MRDNPYFTELASPPAFLQREARKRQKPNIDEFKAATQAALDVLNSCLCCEVHIINKPKKIDDILPAPETGPREQQNKAPFVQSFICHCACRHKARMLCRLAVE